MIWYSLLLFSLLLLHTTTQYTAVYFMSATYSRIGYSLIELINTILEVLIGSTLAQQRTVQYRAMVCLHGGSFVTGCKLVCALCKQGKLVLYVMADA